MPTVEEVEFGEDEYDTSDDEEDEVEEVSIVDKVSGGISATYNGIKKYATPIWKYGGPILWGISTTALLIAMPIIIEVQKEQMLTMMSKEQPMNTGSPQPGVLPAQLPEGQAAPAQ